MPIRFERYTWNRSVSEKQRGVVINTIKDKKTIGGLPSREYGTLFAFEELITYRDPGKYVNPRHDVGVKEFLDKLGAVVSIDRYGQPVRRTLAFDGSTVIVAGARNLMSFTLFKEDGKYDSKDEPGDFGYTTIL